MSGDKTTVYGYMGIKWVGIISIRLPVVVRVVIPSLVAAVYRVLNQAQFSKGKRFFS